MGLRSAAVCCQRLTNAIRYVMRSHGFDLVAYLDDMMTAECWDKAEACFSTLRKIIASMEAVEARSKAVGPCTRMNFLGICFDTELLMMEVPQERVSECMGLLMEWPSKSDEERGENRIPDALSRWDLGEEHRLWFKEVTEGLGPKEMYVHPGLFEFVHDW